MNHITDWEKVNKSDFHKSLHMKLVSSDNITVCRVNIDDRIMLSSHAHENEQISYVISGEMIIKIGEVERFMSAGDICVIPSNVTHSVEILSCPFQSIDIFSPIRSDFLEAIEK